MTEPKDQSGRKWLDDAEAALDKAAESLRVAWEESRDARMSALEAARDAAGKLGDAIDQGIDAAKAAWRPSTEQSPSGEADAGPDSRTEAGVIDEDPSEDRDLSG